MKLTNLLKTAALLIAVHATSAQALHINFIPTPATSPIALAGFQAAALRWESVLHDNVTVNLNIDFSQLPPGVLGSTGSNREFYYYNDFRTYLNADAWGATDQQATAGLNQSKCMNIYMNGTTTNPNGSKSNTPWLDNNCSLNNQVISLSIANARALGLHNAVDNQIDGSVSFSNQFTWDFNPTDGIAGNAFDFIGVATHEIGHALGFISGVDILDSNFSGNYTENAFTYVAPMDLFRCSQASRDAGADLDWAADKRDKYFSLDNCQTQIAQFSTGRVKGDGQQNSHWKDNQHLGILDPTAARGELLAITGLDLQMYDAIGWNVVPEPASIALMLFGLAGLAGARRRK